MKLFIKNALLPPLILALSSCGGSNTASAESTKDIMAEKIVKHFNEQTSEVERIEYTACMEKLSLKDADFIMKGANQLEEEKRGWKDFKSAKLIDKCPQAHTAHCANGPNGPDDGSEFYYAKSEKMLSILKEECTAEFEGMNAEDKEIAAKVGGKWTSFVADTNKPK